MPIIVKGNFINATGQKNSYYAANVRQLSLSLQSFDRFRFLYRIDGNWRVVDKTIDYLNGIFILHKGFPERVLQKQTSLPDLYLLREYSISEAAICTRVLIYLDKTNPPNYDFY